MTAASRYTCPTSGDSYGKPGNCPDCGDTLYVERQAVESPRRKCECVTTSANNPDDLREFADPNCKLCDGDGWQKRETPLTGIACDNCGEPDARHDRQEWDTTPTDRGQLRREYTAHYCTPCWNEMEAKDERAAERTAEERTRYDYFGF